MATLVETSLNPSLDDLLIRVALGLQLSDTQYRMAEGRYRAVADWLNRQDGHLVQFSPRMFPQGSLRLGTTVKPQGRTEFDLDMVALLSIDFRSLRHSRELLMLLEADLRANKTYASMVEVKDRCVRLAYANEFHLDIAPACPDSALGNGCIIVADSRLPLGKGTNPVGYAEWFESRAATRVVLAEAIEPLPPHDATLNKAPLKFVIQLFKRWRDIAYQNSRALAPASCVLTTLAAMHYQGEPSVAKAFSRCIRLLDAALPAEAPPVLLNPAHPREELTEGWRDNPSAYYDFLGKLRALAQTWEQLEAARGIHRAADILRPIFGEEPIDRGLREQAERMNAARRDGKLRVAGRSGLLVGSPMVTSVAVRPNTFHGEP